ncbi:MAG: ABC transporter permease [Christensenella sp.]|nr:ABC transporter permease [Christensenella sp.]
MNTNTNKKSSWVYHIFYETKLGWLFALMVLAYVGMGLMSFALKGNFKYFAPNTLLTMAGQIPEVGILAIGIILPMITGGIDLSMVGKANLSGIVAAAFMTSIITETTPEGTQTLVAIAAIVIAMGVGALAGLLNGLIISEFNAPPLIVTLGSNYAFMGIAVVITQGKSIVGLPAAFNSMGQGKFLGVLPNQFVILVLVVAVIWFLTSRTPYGTKLFMTGSNVVAAEFSGINIKRLLRTTYTISGVLAAISGCILFGRSNQANADYGTTYTLQAIMIAVLGGTSPDGGEGNVLGVLFAMFTMQFLATGMNFFQVTNVTYLKDIVWGGVLLIVMVVNYVTAIRRDKNALKKAF